MSIKLTITTGDGVSTTRVFDNSLIRIGRNSECEVSFADDGNELVSWNHAVISLAHEPVVVDQNSSNGTFVNQERIEGAHRIAVDDKIGLGRSGPTVQVVALSVEKSRTAISETGSLTHEPRTVWKLIIGALTFTSIVAVLVMVATKMHFKKAVKPTAMVHKTERAAVVVAQPPNVVKKTRRPDFETHSLAPAEAPTAKAASQPLDSQQILELYENTVVWAGMKIPDPNARTGSQSPTKSEDHDSEHFMVVPWCTGWISSENRVTIPGERAIDFQTVRERDSIQAIVYQASTSDQTHAVDSIKLHANYDPKSPTSTQSLLHSSGELAAERLEAFDFPRATIGKLMGKTVFVLGYYGISDETPTPFSPLAAPELSLRVAKVTGSRPCSNCGEHVPLIQIEFNSPASLTAPTDEAANPRFDGMLAVDEWGGVIGSVITLSDGIYIVSIENTLPR